MVGDAVRTYRSQRVITPMHDGPADVHELKVNRKQLVVTSGKPVEVSLRLDVQQPPQVPLVSRPPTASPLQPTSARQTAEEVAQEQHSPPRTSVLEGKVMFIWMEAFTIHCCLYDAANKSWYTARHDKDKNAHLMAPCSCSLAT